MRSTTLLGFLAVCWLLLPGCGTQERTITVTSEPPGALCYLNDVEIGKTPCDTGFKFFGTYDVRLVLPGYQPLMTSRETEQPFYEVPGIDLFAAALPGTRRTDIRWHFVLVPEPEAALAGAGTAGDSGARLPLENELIERAKRLRAEAAAGGTPAASATASPDAPDGGSSQ